MASYAVNVSAVMQQAMAPILQEALTRSVYLVEADLVSQVVAATAEATARTAKTVVTLGELLRQGVAEMGPKLEAAHAELAKGAQLATIEAYEVARAAGRHSPAYRANAADPNHRYAGGFLRAALASDGFTTATSEGILFGNVALLDASARQWARLNFGAGAAAGEGGGGRTFNVRWSNLEAASLGIEEEPRPAFRIPAGYWFGAEFYPVSAVPQGFRRPGLGRRVRQEARMTRGIRAEHWLDAGVEYIAKNLPETYRNIYQQIWDEAKAGAHEAGGVTLTRPGRPR